MIKIIKISRKREIEIELGQKDQKMTKRELFWKIMRELGKSEDILIRENGKRIRI